MTDETRKERQPPARGLGTPFGKGETSPASEGLGIRPTGPPKADGRAPFDKGDEMNFSVLQLAWELGYTIAIPIVLLALLGRWGDRMLDTAPWLLLCGVLFSIVISSIIVYRKIKRIL